jgi:hypothetical protein
VLAHPDDSIDLGRRLYREGIGVDGKPVTAIVQGDVPVTGSQLACAGCHKRSGLGASEGGSRALVVTAAALFGPVTAQPAKLLVERPPYDDRTFEAAIEAGRASDGRTLDVLMPRYRLSDADMSALVAYERVLGTEVAPGIGETEIELATIVSADAPARDREAVATVVQRFADVKNAGTRNEQRRAAASRRHLYGERHARAFRNWRVSVWTLTGPPSGWPAQLDALYAQRPPFAVISGAAGDDWPVVDEFCERKELPCLLPVTALPRANSGSFFNLYYSAGVRLDARVTARSIDQGFNAADGNVVVVHTDDARGRAARDSFLGSWPSSRRASVVLRAVAPRDAVSPQYWQELIERERPGVLVAWVAAEQLQGLVSATGIVATPPRRIYTAESFTEWTTTRAPPDFERRVLHIYPYNLPAPGLAQFPREQAWLSSQGLEGLETRAAAAALFACHAVGEAMLGMADNYSREYLIETLEHMLDGTSMTSLFPVTTLGTGQRYLVKGAYVARLVPQGQDVRYVSGGWLQP